MRLRFVASLTTSASIISRICEALAQSRCGVKPFRRVLVTPLFARPSTIETVRRLKEGGSIVYFDSGGYYVQQGKLRYRELLGGLEETYRRHPWADYYLLPDYVPNSNDSDRDVRHKVSVTIQAARKFMGRLPRRLQDRAVPVIHGRHEPEVARCVEAYLSLGVRLVAFGSLATVGLNNASNVLTVRASAMVRQVSEMLTVRGVDLHLLGVGVPAVVGLLPWLGVRSFDSSSWMRAAAFGHIFFPFLRSYSLSSMGERAFRTRIREEKFLALKALTGHDCSFCRDMRTLRSNYIARMAHNLLVIAESVEMLEKRQIGRIQRIYSRGSITYRRRFTDLTIQDER